MAKWQGDTGFLPNTSFASGPLNLPRGLDVRSTIPPTTFRPWSPAPACQDIILLAEFSEIEGPIPLLTIPQTPSLQIDLNEFVVKVLSTDYLNTSGEFRVYEDTQMVQQDINPGVHVYVHYFTLYDVRARGFVRPMCLSYISSDSRKLLHYFSQLRQHFILATECLKLSNLEWFSKEMGGLVRDLEYTKDRYIQVQRNVLDISAINPTNSQKHGHTEDMEEEDVDLMADNQVSYRTESYVQINYLTSATGQAAVNLPEPPENLQLPNTRSCDPEDNIMRSNKELSLQPEKEDSFLSSNTNSDDDDEESLLRHTSLEAVAMQLMECQHILDVVRPHMVKKEIEGEMNCLAEQIESKPQSPLYKAMNNLSMFEKPVEKTKPSVCVLSLMKRNFKDMRSVHHLCGVGYVGCLFKLWSIHGVFCKSFITLKFEDLDRDIYDNPFSSLFIGNIPIINVSKDEKCKLPVQPSSYSALCWDTHFVKFLLTSTSRTSTPDSEYAETLETSRGNVSAAADCLKVFPMVMGDDGDAVLSSKSNDESQTVDQSIPENVDIESVTVHQDSKDEFKTEKDLDVDSSKLNASQKITKEIQDEVAMTGSSNRRNVSKLSTSSSTSWSSNPPLDLSSFVDIQEEEEVEEDIAAVLGEQPIPRVDIGNRMIISKVCRLSGLVQQFCGVSHCLVHALLSGRLVVLAAAEYYRPLVMLYVRALSTLLPRSPTNQLPVHRWHTGTITDHHLKQFRLMGICIPERLHVQDLMTNSTLNQVTVLNIETGHISGVAYSGTLVRGVEHYGRKLFVSTSALQASLQSILVSLGLKVYLLYHLMETTSRSASDILKAIAVTKGDWDIIIHLTGIVQRQLNK
ncbi:guanine nucleotide exchange protein SMCR8 isoform X2 [Procambarus clarkii]|uniref:guanine nucleotide exchange protein SMCR8 isoform X2 n=1 Tax=Procambarus clarkii TaxID=6728 RepID=UPI001E674426|nr:uncharacterized protein LOC123756504 isoform X2 [Procambarus clarkii]